MKKEKYLIKKIFIVHKHSDNTQQKDIIGFYEIHFKLLIFIYIYIYKFYTKKFVVQNASLVLGLVVIFIISLKLIKLMSLIKNDDH